MKKLTIILFFAFATVICHAQGLVTGGSTINTGGTVYYSQFPTAVYSANSWSSLASLFDTAAVSASISGGDIQIAQGDPTNWNHFFCYKDSLTAAHVRGVIRFKMTSSLTSSNYGLAAGFRSVNPTVSETNTLVPDCSTGTGQFQFFINSTSYLTVSSAKAITYHQNDEMLEMIEKNNNTIRCYVQDITTNVIADTTFTIPNNASGFPANLYEFGVFSQGTTQTCLIDSISLQVFEPTYPDLLLIGDSKTTGYGATSYTSCWASLLKQNYPNIAVWAGGGNTTASALSSLSQVIASHPKNVLINGLGSNDIRYSIATATWEANYDSIITKLQRAGINVMVTNGMAETSLDLSSQRNWIMTNFPSYIDTWTTSTRTGFNYSDGIHLSTSGNQWIYDVLKARLPTYLQNVQVVNPNQ